jgi:hypothetical protein
MPGACEAEPLRRRRRPGHSAGEQQALLLGAAERAAVAAAGTAGLCAVQGCCLRARILS